MADNPRPLNDLPVDRARPGDYIVGLQGDNARRFQWPFINGDAMALDSRGNPTPDTSVYNPSDYPEGTVFRALNYPAAVDGGAMEFTLISGAWVWTHGTYRASNNNGSYVRSADGSQECRIFGFTAERYSGDLLRHSWNYPASFAHGPISISFTPRLNSGLLPNGDRRQLSSPADLFADNTVQTALTLVAARGYEWPTDCQALDQSASATGTWK